MAISHDARRASANSILVRTLVYGLPLSRQQAQAILDLAIVCITKRLVVTIDFSIASDHVPDTELAPLEAKTRDRLILAINILTVKIPCPIALVAFSSLLPLR
jgi:hypothetical protein